MNSTQADMREIVARMIAVDWAFCDDSLKEQYRKKADRILATVAPQTPASERAHDEWWNSLTPDQRWQFQTGHQIASGAQPEEQGAVRVGPISLDEHLSRIQLRLRAALRELGRGDDHACSQHLGDALREIAALRADSQSQETGGEQPVSREAEQLVDRLLMAKRLYCEGNVESEDVEDATDALLAYISQLEAATDATPQTPASERAVEYVIDHAGHIVGCTHCAGPSAGAQPEGPRVLAERGMSSTQTDEQAILELFGIEYESDIDAYWVPAEPGPVECDSLIDALKTWRRIYEAPPTVAPQTPASERAEVLHSGGRLLANVLRDYADLIRHQPALSPREVEVVCGTMVEAANALQPEGPRAQLDLAGRPQGQDYDGNDPYLQGLPIRVHAETRAEGPRVTPKSWAEVMEAVRDKLMQALLEELLLEQVEKAVVAELSELMYDDVAEMAEGILRRLRK